MKEWQCPTCFSRRKTIDNVVICICPACIDNMKLIKFEEEEKENDRRIETS